MEVIFSIIFIVLTAAISIYVIFDKRAIKYLEKLDKIEDIVMEAVREVEKFQNLTGEEKKKIATAKINKALHDLKLDVPEGIVSALIDKLVEFSNKFNKKE